MTATPTPIRRVNMGATSCHWSLSGSYLNQEQHIFIGFMVNSDLVPRRPAEASKQKRDVANCLFTAAINKAHPPLRFPVASETRNRWSDLTCSRANTLVAGEESRPLHSIDLRIIFLSLKHYTCWRLVTPRPLPHLQTFCDHTKAWMIVENSTMFLTTFYTSNRWNALGVGFK